MGDILAEASFFLTPATISKQISQEDMKELQISTPSLPSSESKTEYQHDLEKKAIVTEDTQAILTYSTLLQQVNKMIRLIQNLSRESKILMKIKKIITFNETMDPEMICKMISFSPNINNIMNKVINLQTIYAVLDNHRNFLADYLVMFFGAILENFKIYKNIDYCRVLYMKKQITKCKLLLLNNIKEGCPSAYEKYLKLLKSHYIEKTLKDKKVIMMMMNNPNINNGNIVNNKNTSNSNKNNNNNNNAIKEQEMKELGDVLMKKIKAHQ